MLCKKIWYHRLFITRHPSQVVQRPQVGRLGVAGQTVSRLVCPLSTSIGSLSLPTVKDVGTAADTTPLNTKKASLSDIHRVTITTSARMKRHHSRLFLMNTASQAQQHLPLIDPLAQVADWQADLVCSQCLLKSLTSTLPVCPHKYFVHSLQDRTILNSNFSNPTT